MNTASMDSREELVHVLALLIASKGRVEKREWLALARADDCLRVGVSAARLSELIDDSMRELGPNLLDHQWFSSENLNQIDKALAQVTDADQRLLVCRLAASALWAEDHPSGYDGLELDHALARWHLTKSMVFHTPTVDASTGAPIGTTGLKI